MKVYICLTLIAAALFLQVAEAAALDHDDVNKRNDIDLCTALKMFIKSFKRIMPCGYAALEIPALAPVCVNHYEFNRNNSFLNIGGNVTNFRIYGLSNIEELAFECNADTNRLFFDINFPQIQAFGEYEMVDTFNLAGFPFTLAGNGLLNKKINDLRLVGEVVLENAKSLKIEYIKFHFYVGSITNNNWNNKWDDSINNFVNKFTSELGLLWTQQIQKHVDEFSVQYFLPHVNDKLKHVSKTKLINELVSRSMEMEMVNC